MDAERNRILFAPHLSWRNEPLRDRLAGRLAVPVLVDNDANTAAWAEWRFGAGRGEDNLVMITLGTGIGGALLEDGQVKRGKFGVAGEFGHMQVVPGGHRCACGNRGCWEQYSSGNALVREARELAAADSPVAYGIIEHVKGNIGDITGPMITELAREGDAMCIELLQDIGQWLGVGIANLAAALDPSCFVIGGGVSAADDLLIGPARDAFRRHLTGRGYRPEARIARAQLGPGPAWSAPPTSPVSSPAASAVPSAAAWSATSGTSASRSPVVRPRGRRDGLAAAPGGAAGRAPAAAGGPAPQVPSACPDAADHRAAHRSPGRLSGDLRQPEPRQRKAEGGEVLGDRPHRGLAVARPAPSVPGADPAEIHRRRLLRDEQLEDQPPVRPVRHRRSGPGEVPRGRRHHRDTLRKNDITIGSRDQKVVGWEFTAPGTWWGLVHDQKDPAPTQDIVVNWPRPGHAMVYVVSRTIP